MFLSKENMNEKTLRIAIYLAGATYPAIKEQYGDFEDWFAREITKHNAQTVTFDVRNGEYIQNSEYDGIVITGSSASVRETERVWISDLLQHLRDVFRLNVPTLGVCFGHQALVAASGGEVIKHEVEREIGTKQLYLTDEGMKNPLFKDISPPFHVQETHEDVAIRIPENKDFQVLAWNEHSKFQSVAFSDVILSTQFHPEITAEILREYAKVYSEKNPDAMVKNQQKRLQNVLNDIRDTDVGTKIIRNFLSIVRKK
jgi:GMP synthase (glutamine-hydrolysing)